MRSTGRNRVAFAAACAAAIVVASLAGAVGARAAAPFKVFMIASTAPDHLQMTAMARTALAQMGQTNGFTVDFTTDGTLINDANLAGYQVFLQMHLAPFEINLEQRGALERFVQQGKGWVGVHGAGLIIPSSYVKRNYPDWTFYSTLLGGIVWLVHPALQTGTVTVEDRTHPATKNLPASFSIRDEWYEWDKNPRANVHVLGGADEKTYQQVKPQGDHPMIWTCPGFQRAIYIGIGHDASDWGNTSFTTLMRDSLLWAASGNVTAPAPDGGAADASGAEAGDAAGEGGGAGGASGTGGQPPATGTGGGSGSGGAAPVGSGGAPAGGSGGAGAAPGSTSSGGSSGCSIVDARRAGAGAAPLALVLALAFVMRRRRR